MAGIYLIVGGPLCAFAIIRDTLGLLLALLSLSTPLNFGYLGVTYTALQNLMHPRIWATAAAVLNAVYGFVAGLAPVVPELFSDAMALTLGASCGLALAMAPNSLVYGWAGLH